MKTRKKSNAFIALGKKHVMRPHLNGVVQSSWLSYKDCNIFTIGEVHESSQKCMDILTMFKALLLDRPKSLLLDIMIEDLPYDLDAEFETPQLNDQINQIRTFFEPCIKYHNCPVRVHWTDPSESYQKIIHEWLLELAKYDFFLDDWTKNKKITPFFKKESDMSKLLTENRIVVKEIHRASKVNPAFTMEFATNIFMKLYEHEKERYKYPWEKLVTLQTRHVMDIYTVARLIKLDMKNIIFYAGYSHTEAVIQILVALHFKINKIVDGKCFT